ncbi:hypothetical protein WJX74_006852 [Apatococcus lobatus]|uniref:Essential protein Yae1 N-terminal domain-containing protein n=1 Tax=Apatococcus lobatus TaxID=904363 RepID=A0AAW1RDL9_9CHLO
MEPVPLCRCCNPAFMSSDEEWDDDMWEDPRPKEEDKETNKLELDREWQTRREQHFNSGYREGKDAGKQEVVQQAFNKGFEAGRRAGETWGHLLGRITSLYALYSRSQSQKASSAEAKQLRDRMHSLNKAALLSFSTLAQSTTASATAVRASSADAKGHGLQDFLQPISPADPQQQPIAAAAVAASPADANGHDLQTAHQSISPLSASSSTCFLASPIAPAIGHASPPTDPALHSAVAAPPTTQLADARPVADEHPPNDGTASGQAGAAQSLASNQLPNGLNTNISSDWHGMQEQASRTTLTHAAHSDSTANGTAGHGVNWNGHAQVGISISDGMPQDALIAALDKASLGAGGTGMSQDKLDAALEVRQLIRDVQQFLRRVQG